MTVCLVRPASACGNLEPVDQSMIAVPGGYTNNAALQSREYMSSPDRPANTDPPGTDHSRIRTLRPVLVHVCVHRQARREGYAQVQTAKVQRLHFEV